MKKWAEIYQSKIRAFHEMPDEIIPEFNPSSMRYLRDVTDRNPMPGIRWLYDPDTDIFTDPGPVSITNITSKDFYLRLTGAERIAFIESTNSGVKQFEYWLTLSGDVDLTDEKVIAGANHLESQGVIGAGRAAEILVIDTV